jgi:hypothetical protein
MSKFHVVKMIGPRSQDGPLYLGYKVPVVYDVDGHIPHYRDLKLHFCSEDATKFLTREVAEPYRELASRVFGMSASAEELVREKTISRGLLNGSPHDDEDGLDVGDDLSLAEVEARHMRMVVLGLANAHAELVRLVALWTYGDELARRQK